MKCGDAEIFSLLKKRGNLGLRWVDLLVASGSVKLRLWVSAEEALKL
jgi:hypothetical protein